MSPTFFFLFFLQIALQTTSRTAVDLATPLLSIDGFQIFGSDTGDLLGYSVSSAGDVNDDGINDIILGAPDYGPSNLGGVYVIYGKPPGSNINIDLSTATFTFADGFIIFPHNSGGSLGISVSRAGDFNDDGVADIIVGDSLADHSMGVDSGAAYVIYGKAGGRTSNVDLNVGLPLSEGLRISGMAAGHSLGISVSFAGDFNDDNVDDVIVGACYAKSLSLIATGEAYVIYGQTGGFVAHLDLSSSFSTSQGLRIGGKIASELFGYSVGAAGDINNDGVHDVVIGAPDGRPPGYTGGLGMAYVIYGKTTFASHMDLATSFPFAQGFQILSHSVENTNLGFVVGPAGDFNGDGVADIIISDPNGKPSVRANAGVAYVLYGKSGGFTANINLNAGLLPAQGVKISGTAGESLGTSVSSAGDFNNDGVSDIIVGAQNAIRSSQASAGVAYVIYGKTGGFSADFDLSTSLTSTEGFEISGSATNANLGCSVAYGGDLNGDGIADILVGSKSLANSALTTAGAAYILYSYPYTPPPTPSTPTTPTTPSTPSPIPNCISFIGSKCLLCANGYLLYFGDNRCYLQNSCPFATSPNSTHCVDKILETVGTTQALASKSATLVASAITLVSFTNPIGLLFAALGESLLYMKYMSITYPPKLQYILNQPEASLYEIQYITSAAEEVEDEIRKYPLADNFERNDVHSSFLINFWSSLTTLVFIKIAIVIVCLSTYFTKRFRSVNSAISQVKRSLKWNYLIATFSNSYGPVVFFSSFEFRTVQFESALETLSFIICVLMNIILLAISMKIFLIIRALIKEKNPKRLKRLRHEFRDYEVVFENFKGSSFSQQSYFLISCARFYIFYIILGYLFEHPLIQAILINIQGIIFLAYLCIKRPFESKLEFVQTLIMEFTFQVIHACVLGLAIADETGSETGMHAVNLGDTMMICICVFVGAQCIYLIIQMFGLLITLFKFIKNTFYGKPASKRNAAVPSLRNSGITKDIFNNHDRGLNIPRITHRRNLLRPMQPAVLARQNEISTGAYVVDNEMRNPVSIDVQDRQNKQETWDKQVLSSEGKTTTVHTLYRKTFK